MQVVAPQLSPAELRVLARRARAAMNKQFYDPVDKEVCREFADFLEQEAAAREATAAQGAGTC